MSHFFTIHTFLYMGSCIGFRLSNLLWGLLIFYQYCRSPKRNKTSTQPNFWLILWNHTSSDGLKTDEELLLQADRDIVEPKMTPGNPIQNLAPVFSFHVLSALWRYVHYQMQLGRSLRSCSKEVSIKEAWCSLCSTWMPQHSQQILSAERQAHQSLVPEVPCCWMETPGGTAWYFSFPVLDFHMINNAFHSARHCLKK